jgi:type I restriction enzyme S subunit
MDEQKITLPESWAAVKLGDFVESEKGKKPKSESKTKTESHNLPYIDIQAFEENVVRSWADGTGCRICYESDFLMVWDGSRSGLVGKGKSGALGSTLVRIYFPSMVNDYAFYFLQSKYQQINTRAKGVGIPHVDPALLWNYEFPIAPLAEQNRIVTKIEELFSELDKGIESLKTAREQLKIYRQALLKNAFEGKLTADMNKGIWPQKSLHELLDYLTSGSRGWSSYYAAEGDLFIRAQNIKHDRLELDDIAFVALPERAEGLRSRVQKGDLLITVTGANVTKSAVIENDVGVAYVSQHVALCRPSKEVFPKFLYWFIISESAGRKQLNKMAYGAGKPGLSLENIRAVVVSLPSLVEQKKIVELIEAKLSETDQLDQTITTALQQADALRQSILKKAFSGQLVAQDASDEPASVLLARIKKEAK